MPTLPASPKPKPSAMPRHLSGIQPSGLPHLGNYFGAIAQHVEVSRSADPASKDALFFIADLHALTSLHDRVALDENVRSIAATYLALGLDAERALFFRQSDIPEVTELMWLLMTVTGMGLLERAHSYKDKVARGLPASVGLFTYPVLMTADIVIYDTDVVPVGQDQIQHVEMAQDMVTHFNTTYRGEHLRRPEWRLSKTPKVPGKDGAKMSKSYGNDIWIFEEGKALKRSVNAIVTDSRPPEEPKDPDGITAYAILELFADEAERADWRARIGKGGVGYGHLKGAIIEKMDARFGPARALYRELLESQDGKRRVEETLARGASIARPLAQATLARCFEAVGMG
ncbi:MAG: tryptophan--tRNA ligase, partial [Deltaproteobacteria bacterium RBG_16_71_12]